MYLKNLFKHWTYQVFFPGTVLRGKYEAFKSLLASDKQAHEVMAEIEQIHYDHVRVDLQVITGKYEALSDRVARIIDDLDRLSGARYVNLKDYFRKFDFYIRFMLAPSAFEFAPPFTLPLDSLPEDAGQITGGKAFHLSQVKKHLNLPINPGFVITTNAFNYLLEYNGLREIIEDRLSRLDIHSGASLENTADELSRLVLEAAIPEEVEVEIHRRFEEIWPGEQPVRLAVRSSAVAEDTQSSFAGQYRTVLNVRPETLLDAYRQVIASKYTASAIFYRVNYGLADFETPMAVLILEMVDARTSGVMYTLARDDDQREDVSIHALWGLGELLVSGEAAPDIYRVTRTTPHRLTKKDIADKARQFVSNTDGSVAVTEVPPDRARRPCLSPDEVLRLAEWGMQLEGFYDAPQDVEWCIDRQGSPYILQSRPLAADAPADNGDACKLIQPENAVLVNGGLRASAGVGAGRVYRARQGEDLGDLPEGCVFVARNASPHYVKVLDRVSAVVTATGSSAGHFASVAREFGVPVVVNIGEAMEKLAPGMQVTVHADAGKIYEGIVAELMTDVCARRDLTADSPLSRRLTYIISFISPLRLVDPESPDFTPENCRSLHDIIRFSHEKAVQEMFSLGNRSPRKTRNTKKFVSHIPMLFYLLDVGDGLSKTAAERKEIGPDEILSVPMRALWKGLSHPDIHWSGFSHFDWDQFDSIAMGGGMISKNSSLLASYAIVSHDYLNLNLKFGYHFVIVDTVCGDETGDNYLLFRFTGGGGDFDGRSRRADFITAVLDRLGFTVQKKGDLVDAEVKNVPRGLMEDRLDMLGRLLGATRLMDMYLKNDAPIEGFVEEFMGGRYHFGK
jgi:pyruvate,water dikinase